MQKLIWVFSFFTSNPLGYGMIIDNTWHKKLFVQSLSPMKIKGKILYMARIKGLNKEV